MAFKKFRKMKVYEASGYNYKRTPSIILKGDWLKETGFYVGGLIQVECENGKLIITPREEEEVEYHAPCGKCMMVAEECKCYGKKGRRMLPPMLHNQSTVPDSSRMQESGC